MTLVNDAGKTLSVWDGQPAPTITEQAVGRSFEVMADGFWQVHPAAADTLAGAVRRAAEGAAIGGRAAWDLYGGVGLFAAVLAETVGPGGTVVSVEGDRAASELAARNLRRPTGGERGCRERR